MIVISVLPSRALISTAAALQSLQLLQLLQLCNVATLQLCTCKCKVAHETCVFSHPDFEIRTTAETHRSQECGRSRLGVQSVSSRVLEQISDIVASGSSNRTGRFALTCVCVRVCGRWGDRNCAFYRTLRARSGEVRGIAILPHPPRPQLAGCHHRALFYAVGHPLGYAVRTSSEKVKK